MAQEVTDAAVSAWGLMWRAQHEPCLRRLLRRAAEAAAQAGGQPVDAALRDMVRRMEHDSELQQLVHTAARCADRVEAAERAKADAAPAAAAPRFEDESLPPTPARRSAVVSPSRQSAFSPLLQPAAPQQQPVRSGASELFSAQQARLDAERRVDDILRRYNVPRATAGGGSPPAADGWSAPPAADGWSAPPAAAKEPSAAASLAASRAAAAAAEASRLAQFVRQLPLRAAVQPAPLLPVPPPPAAPLEQAADFDADTEPPAYAPAYAAQDAAQVQHLLSAPLPPAPLPPAPLPDDAGLRVGGLLPPPPPPPPPLLAASVRSCSAVPVPGRADPQPEAWYARAALGPPHPSALPRPLPAALPSFPGVRSASLPP